MPPKWYQTSTGIILLLILFFPVGLYLMWKDAPWNKKAKWAVTNSLILFFAISSIIGLMGDSKITSAPVATVPVASQPTPAIPEKVNIIVSSQMGKKVDGKYRYFFDIRNEDRQPFEGKVTITLFNTKETSPLASEIFTTNNPIEPGLGTSVFLDANTAPVAIHGDYGISTFKFTVEKNSFTINEGEGTISEEFEET